jgi:hypothetical protein
MKYYDRLCFEGDLKEVEKLVKAGVISLDDLSIEAFELFKIWIERTRTTTLKAKL